MRVKSVPDRETFLTAGWAMVSLIVMGWLVHALMWREFRSENARNARIPQPGVELTPESPVVSSKPGP